MDPADTARGYDALAGWWRDRHRDSRSGLALLDRAIALAGPPGRALDAGCGSSGRFIRHLIDAGYEPEGIDVSPAMIAGARQVHPGVAFEVADIATWSKPGRYRLITAWDSTFHLPLDLQEPALRNLATSLAPGGVLLFTCGGTDEPGEISGGFEGQSFDYSTLGIPGFLALLDRLGLTCRHLEFDQGFAESHVAILARRR